MHEIRKKLLSLGSVTDLSQYTYRQLAERVGAPHAAQVRHHLLQLERQGKIVRDANGGLRTADDATEGAGSFISIPVLGEVDCGVATRFAMDVIEGYLSISPNSTKYRDTEGVFALKACGDSMDEADIAGKTVLDSDYVLVKRYNGEDIADGKYVISLIDGMANLKKFRNDKLHNRVALLSESSKDYPPIFIDESDKNYYEVIGTAVDVIKGVGHLI
jgi:SOS-response transcriptional repressor LexA